MSNEISIKDEARNLLSLLLVHHSVDTEEYALLMEALAQPVQEPVTWDKPSDNFNAWWDGDRRRDNANPFTTDSFAYWAYEGWQAAQRPWVGLTEFQFAEIYNRWNDSNGSTPWGLYHAIEKALKAKNHG